KRLPVLRQLPQALEKGSERAVELALIDSNEDETTYDFAAPPGWPDGVERVTARHYALAALEKEIDEEVYRLYEISAEDRKVIEDELMSGPAEEDDASEDEAESDDEGEQMQEPSLTAHELAQLWISYAVGIALGRFSQTGLEDFADDNG